MASSSDNDYFSLTLPAGKTLTATLTPNPASDYDLYVYNSNGTLIGSSERGTGQVDSVAVTNTGTAAFTRYVRIVYYGGGTGATTSDTSAPSSSAGARTLQRAWRNRRHHHATAGNRIHHDNQYTASAAKARGHGRT